MSTRPFHHLCTELDKRDAMTDDEFWEHVYPASPHASPSLVGWIMSTHDQIRDFITRRGLKLHRNVKWEMADYDLPEDGSPDREPAATIDEAEAVSSRQPTRPGEPEGGYHDLLIDIDLPAYLVPSSTEGHHHLYAPLSCAWEDYAAFLRAAVTIGLIEEGYANACISRGATSLRLPWVKKGHERAPDGEGIA